MAPLRLVVDATVLFTGLIGKGVTKSLFFSDNLELLAPEFLFEEFSEHKSRIKSISALPAADIDFLMEKLEDTINVVKKSKFEKFLKEASSLINDPEDTEYLALSLSLDKCPIWSNDPHFKKQSLVRVFTTNELVEHLKSEGLF